MGAPKGATQADTMPTPRLVLSPGYRSPRGDVSAAPSVAPPPTLTEAPAAKPVVTIEAAEQRDLEWAGQLDVADALLDKLEARVRAP